MTFSELNSDILFLTGTDASSYLIADRTRNINSWYHKTITMVLESQTDWQFDDINHTDFPVATTPLVALQRDYDLPASLKLLNVKRVDITYDGTNYYRAIPFDPGMTSDGLGSDTNTDARFSLNTPGYDLLGQSVLIYPRATAAQVTAGAKLRIEFMREVDEFSVSDTTQEPGIDEPFHRILSVGAAFDYALARGLSNKNDLFALLQDYEGRLKTYYGKKQDSEPLVLKFNTESYE